MIGIFLIACEKEITLPLEKNDTRLIIEGNIDDGLGPYFIKLSKSIDITSPNVYPFVNNANIIISDNTGMRDTLALLREGLYGTKKIKGVYGNTYYLEVQLDGQKYTAQCKMPIKINLDSLRINTFPFNGELRYSIIPVYADPIEIGNSYRFIQKINDTSDQIFHVFNDNLNNGKVNQRPLRGGIDSLKVKPNDLISVEMHCINSAIYLYYYSLNQQSGAGPGGGTAPSNPPTNIQGGALGIFSAHTKQLKTIRIK